MLPLGCFKRGYLTERGGVPCVLARSVGTCSGHGTLPDTF
jgi:hypothetical protein